MKARKYLTTILLLGLAACTTLNSNQQPLQPVQDQNEETRPVDDYSYLGLTEKEVDTLLSLKQIDHYPLYTMHYYTPYNDLANLQPESQREVYLPFDNMDWGCSLFTAFANSDNQLYGRNFDWAFSPALLLYTDPPEGYAAATMVDIAYLGFDDEKSKNLTEKPLDELVNLLDSPYLPFDGMNEAGLAIGMAAVPPGNVSVDPRKETIGSLGVIRAVLDEAANVDEALEILQSYNIDFEGGPSIHYLIADVHGNAALLEHYQGEVHIFRNQDPWHQATNFIKASVDSPIGQCSRYDTIHEQLKSAQGNLTPEAAMKLLKDVSQNNTQWSVVYLMSGGELHIAMGRDYDNEIVLPLEFAIP